MRKTPRRARLGIESPEDRRVPATRGIPWPDAQHPTLSLVPDGTAVQGQASQPFGTLDGQLGAGKWEAPPLKAFQAVIAPLATYHVQVGDGTLTARDLPRPGRRRDPHRRGVRDVSALRLVQRRRDGGRPSPPASAPRGTRLNESTQMQSLSSNSPAPLSRSPGSTWRPRPRSPASTTRPSKPSPRTPSGTARSPRPWPAPRSASRPRSSAPDPPGPRPSPAAHVWPVRVASATAAHRGRMASAEAEHADLDVRPAGPPPLHRIRPR